MQWLSRPRPRSGSGFSGSTGLTARSGFASIVGLAGRLAGMLVWAAAPALAASPTALYSITFDASWTAQTHPVNFPATPHFSPLVGITHNDQVVFWQVGALASDGIENMAELGASSPLANEMAAAVVAGDAENALAGSSILSPGQEEVLTLASLAYSRVTLVTMIAPSPDWFLGVSGLDLLSPGPEGDWIAELVVELHAYDAGTDSGVVYTSPDDDTVPAETISLLTSSPFEGAVPLGTFTITRLDNPAEPLPVLSPWGTAILLASLAGLGWMFGRVRTPA